MAKKQKKQFGKNKKRSGLRRSETAYEREFDGEKLVGTLSCTSKGYGFVIVKDREKEVFVAATEMNGAMHGDVVEIGVISNIKGGGEGRVLNIVERADPRIVGTFTSCAGYGYVRPDDARIAWDIYIAQNATLKAQDGEKVVVEMFSRPADGRAEGKVIEILGMPSDKGVDILSVIRSYNLYETFPKGVQKEAAEAPSAVSADEKRGRKDFTDELIITIDGDDSRDFDDAVSLSVNGDLYTLGVHIADVSHYVKAGSKLDKEALKRGTSVYFPDRVLPMLPTELSNGICSLNEGVDRLTLSVIMDIDERGKVVKSVIKEGVIRSKHRMTYKNVAAVLDGDEKLCEKYADVVPMLKEMKVLSQILSNKRKRRGAIEFEIPESEIVLDENGVAIDVKKRQSLVSHKIIEEFMLAANETIAEYMFDRKAPFVYRAHEVPPPEKIEALEDFLSGLGIDFSRDEKAPKSSDFAALLEDLDERIAPVVNRVTLRSMTKASYEAVNKGHFGLAAAFYCHFTSPIRRYPDLAIHRIIKDFLKNGNKAFSKYENIVADIAAQSSERERLSEKAERDVDDMKKAEFMRDKVGKKFKGIISGVTEWGFFVELDNSVEGLVRVEKLKGDNYVYNPRLMSLSNGASFYRIGDPVNVVLESVNESRINFDLSEE